MWDLPRPGLEPTSPALAGRFSTTAPPGKPSHSYFYETYSPGGQDTDVTEIVAGMHVDFATVGRDL